MNAKSPSSSPLKPLKHAEARGRAWMAIALALGLGLFLATTQQRSAPLSAPRLSLGGLVDIAAGTGASSPAASLFGLGGGGGGAPAACDLDIHQGVIAQSCRLIRDVCVDQQVAILHGAEYKESSAVLPVFLPPKRQAHFVLIHKETASRDYRYQLPPLTVRAASVDEPTPYLAQPVFSTCTVPVLYYSHYLINPAHMLRDNAARLYGALNETSWGAHAKVVVMTPLGLGSPRFARQVMTAVNPALSMETWSEFSSRLPSQPAPGGVGYVPAEVLPASPPGAAHSVEGPPQRCFRHMYVCLENLNITNWPLHAYGKHLIRYYSQQLPPEAFGMPAEALPQRLGRSATAAAAAPSGGGNAASSNEGDAKKAPGSTVSTASGSATSSNSSAAGAAAAPNSSTVAASNSQVQAGSGSAAVSSPAVLNVVFHKRTSDRFLLNAAELLEACNAWRYTTPGGVEVRAKCWEVEIADLFTGITAAQQADVFIGSHGANMANGWLMRPGSSVVELTMYEFEASGAHHQYPKRNMLDADTQIQYWKVFLCDPVGSWSMGELEKRERAEGKVWANYWPKWRNLRVRWSVLDGALREVMDVGGDMNEYRQRFADGRWWWLTTANETVYAGRDSFMTCKKAQAEGLIKFGSVVGSAANETAPAAGVAA